MIKFITSKRIIVFFILMLMLFGIYKIWFRHDPDELLEDFTLYEVKKGEITQSLYLSGTVNSAFSQKVTSLASAKINEIFVREGEVVKKGQLLIRLDEDDLITKLETARSKYLKAKVRLEEVKNHKNSASYINAVTNLETAKLESAEKEKDYQLNQKLYAAKGISKQDLDRSRLDMSKAQANLESAQAQLKEAVMKGNRDALDEALAEYKIGEIALAEARTDMAAMKILAPSPGIVNFNRVESAGLGAATAKALTANRPVSPGEVLLIIDDNENLSVDVYIDEFDVLEVKIGQPCLIQIKAVPNKTFSGKVFAISSEITEKGTFFKLRCLIENPEPAIKIGMSAFVYIPLKKKSDAIVIPSTSLIKKGGQSGIFYINQKLGKPEFKPVKVGITSFNEIEIVEGLTEGEKILNRVPGWLIEGRVPDDE